MLVMLFNPVGKQVRRLADQFESFEVLGEDLDRVVNATHKTLRADALMQAGSEAQVRIGDRSVRDSSWSRLLLHVLGAATHDRRPSLPGHTG